MVSDFDHEIKKPKQTNCTYIKKQTQLYHFTICLQKVTGKEEELNVDPILISDDNGEHMVQVFC